MKKTILFFLVFFPVCLCAQLKINEIMVKNVSAVMDDAYNYSMWIEIYNPSQYNPDNLSDYYLTDDLSNPKKWKPSNNVIPPGDFTVVWFERPEIEGHSPFKLEPEGGKLYLFDSGENLIDNIHYPSQYRNISYGRKNDGTGEWAFFEDFSPGESNNNHKFLSAFCSDPVFELEGGFYDDKQYLSFKTPEPGETIYYTLNGKEPEPRESFLYLPNTKIALNTTSIVRAKTYSKDKLSSNVLTHTYFINERDFNLMVVSIVTEPENLWDDMIGIYVRGVNGIPDVCNLAPSNWNQDWSRPANFELYDVNGKNCLNQELDIKISGGCTRAFASKSFKIKPRKKFGDNYLKYDIFSASKPDRMYKDIKLRNSGNDFHNSMMADAFAHSLVAGRMNMDYQAYEPAVCFINGEYYGILNLRECTSADYLFSNYGFKEDEITLIRLSESTYKEDPEFYDLYKFIEDNDITNKKIYSKVCEMLDVENYIDYFIAEMFFNNQDWPHNNMKVWKPKNGGKWRWILFDTDHSFDLLYNNYYNPDIFDHVLNRRGGYAEYSVFF